MSHCQAALLADRGVIRVAGSDARKFLQGLITNNMDKVAEGKAIHAALLSPQGKILFDFFVIEDGQGGFLLDVARDKAAELAKRLGFYKLRADVAVTEEPHQSVAAMGGGATDAREGAIAFADPRLAELGGRMILPEGMSLSGIDCVPGGEDDYHRHRIALGVPEGGRDYAFGETFPHEALLDQLNGVDFTKGCFIGQEVVSRMEHRGTARRRIVPVEGDAPLPACGIEIVAGEIAIGTLGSVSETMGLAMLRLDRAEQALAQGKPLTAGGVTLQLHRPAFVRFDVPDTRVSA